MRLKWKSYCNLPAPYSTISLFLSTIGVVFPYYPREGRYKLNYHQAEDACKQQDAILASHSQLHKVFTPHMDSLLCSRQREVSDQY